MASLSVYLAAFKTDLPFFLQYLNEAKWNKTLMKSILSVCHIYDEEKNYVAFDEGAKSEDPIFKVVRTVL